MAGWRGAAAGPAGACPCQLIGSRLFYCFPIQECGSLLSGFIRWTSPVPRISVAGASSAPSTRFVGGGRRRAAHARPVAAEAGGAVGRARHGVDRHRQARPDAAAGPRPGHAGARRHPLDSGDDDGARGADRAAARARGRAGHDHPGAEQSAARAGAARTPRSSSKRPRRRSPACASSWPNEVLAQEATTASIEADYQKAALQAKVNQQLAEKALVSTMIVQQSTFDAQQLVGAPDDRQETARQRRRRDPVAARGAAVRGRSGARDHAAEAPPGRRAARPRRRRRRAAGRAG